MSREALLSLSVQDAGTTDIEAVRRYWEAHIHDSAISDKEIGSIDFFHDLEQYRFEKLSYLPSLLDSFVYRGQKVLEAGCGMGIDLAYVARSGATVTGVDLSAKAIELAKKNLSCHGLQGNLMVMNGEELDFQENSFDRVYAHGVLQYAADPSRMVKELYRVLKPQGQALMMVYNRYSWLNLLSRLTKVELEHEDAPVFNTYSIREFEGMLSDFSKVEIIPERFPVKTRLHRGLKARLYNSIFVNLFNMIPKPMVRTFGWHLLATATK